MIAKSTINGQILLWDNARINETDNYRITSVIDMGGPARHLPLIGVYEITIAGNYTLEHLLLNGNLVFIIPIAGSFTYSHNNFSETCSPGTVNILPVTASNKLYFTNRDSAQVSLFIFIFKTNYFLPNAISTVIPVRYNNITAINTLQVDSSVIPFFIRTGLGIFAGRQKFSYRKQNIHTKTFLWILNGAFEACEVLLHSRDAYIVTGCHEIDGEALSNNAAILFIEFAG